MVAKTCWSRVLIGAALMTMLTAGAVRAGEIRRADLLPKEADIIFALSDVSGFIAGVENSPPGKVWNDPLFQEFIGKACLTDLLKESLLQIPAVPPAGPESDKLKASRLQWEQISSLKGELIVAVAVEKNAPVFFFAYRTSEETYRKNLDIDRQIIRLKTEEDGQISEKECEGVTLYRLTRRLKDKTEDAWQAFYGGTAIESNRQEWVEAAIGKLKNSAVKEPEAPAHLTVKCLGKLIDKFFDKDEEEKKNDAKQAVAELTGPATPIGAAMANPPSARQIAEALGVCGLREITLTVTPQKGSFQVDIRVDGVPEKLDGLWGVFSAGPLSPSLRFPFVPNDVKTYSAANVDLKTLWNRLSQTLARLNPGYEAIFNFAKANAETSLGLNLEQDIIRPLGPLWITFDRAEKDRFETLYADRLDDAQAMEKTLEKMFGEGRPLNSPSIKAEKYLDHMVYALELPRPPMPMGKTAKVAPLPRLAFSVAGGYLLIGDADLVRGAVQAMAAGQRRDPAFYDSAPYREMTEKLPENVLGFSVTDLRAYLKGVGAMLKSEDTREAFRCLETLENCPGSPKVSEIARRFNPDKFPGADRLGEYLSLAISYSLLKDGAFETRLRIDGPEEKR